MLYTLADLKIAFKDCVVRSGSSLLSFENVAIDSRVIKNNDIFFALKGEKNDGHIFIKSALQNGAKCVVCEYVPQDIIDLIESKSDIAFLVVQDTMHALADLASFNRSRLNAKVIGVTGNIGKTTVKELLRFGLSEFFNVHASIASYNNHTGMPMTLANTPVDTEVLILEMGMNHGGEIEYLSKIAKPDISIITTIAPAHVAFFNSVEDICKAKAEIFKGMNSNGIAILNKENAYFDILNQYAKEEGVKNVFTVGTEDSHLYIKNCKFDKLYRTHYSVCLKDKLGNIESVEAETDGVSYHNAFNTLFAFAIAKLFRVNLTDFANKLAKFSLVKGRGIASKVHFDNKVVHIIDDSYNSSPEALKTAIKSLSNFVQIASGARAVVVIGDMKELGDQAEKYHREILQEILKTKISAVYTVGENMKIVHDGLPDSIEKKHFQSTQDLTKVIRKLLNNKDVALFKASRSMKLEDAINKLYNE